MAAVNIFWDPAGMELNSLGTNQFLRITDGDTPYVSMAIRMLSIDTPEVHYPGTQNPAKHDAKLAQLADWIQAGKAPIGEGLAAYLHPKLATGTAGTLQARQGAQATEAFQQFLADRLTRPKGEKRSVFLRAADQPFDQYGRLLAYMAPQYSDKELATLAPQDRATFNVQMIETGWAASFLVYPSLPKYRDLCWLQASAKSAYQEKRGIWAEPLTLAGYEFRMCYKLWDITRRLEQGETMGTGDRTGWIERYCSDMTTREIVEPQDYYLIEPHNRLFVWPADVNEAVAGLNLAPRG